MSIHEIEGLVEDSIRIIDKSTKSLQEKRNLMYNLYAFQNGYDTGYTHFRLPDILKKNQFLFSIKLSEHPAYKKNLDHFEAIKKEIQGKQYTWIKPHNAKETIYGVWENGEAVLYFDYGSELWESTHADNTQPKELSLIDLVHQMTELAYHQKDKDLVCNWYAVLVNQFVEREVPFDNDFEKWMQEEMLFNIRTRAIESGIKRYKEDWGYLALPDLTEELDTLQDDEIDRYFMLLFWMKFSASPSKLMEQYHKAKTKYEKAQAARPIKYVLVADTFNPVLVEKEAWTYHGMVKVNDYDAWLWSKDIYDYPSDQFMRIFFMPTFWEEDGNLAPVLGVQNGMLLRWQNREPHHLPAYWHHHHILGRYIPDNELESNKNIDFLLGWKFKLSNADKTIQKRLEDLLNAFTKYSPQFIKEMKSTYNLRQMEGSTFKYYGRKESFEIGINYPIPKKNQFLYADYLSLAHAFLAKDKNEVEIAQRYLESTRILIDQSHPKTDIRAYLTPIVDDLLKGKERDFPLVIHSYFRGTENIPQ